jgi:hypothetical protein
MRVLAIALALLGLTASVAHAAPADGQLWAEVKIAEDYWAARGYVTPCGSVVPSISPVAPDAPVSNRERRLADGWAAQDSCALAITPRRARLAREGAWTRRFDAAFECAVVVHEYGHGALGLKHDDGAFFPVMAETMMDEAIPVECRAFGRYVVRAARG